MSLKTNPRIRKDGTCALRGCSEPLPEAALQDGDPFHTAACCRAYYGVVLTKPEQDHTKRRPRKDKVKIIPEKRKVGGFR